MVKAVCQKDPASWCHELPEGLTTCTVHSHTIRKQGLGYSFVAFIHIQKKIYRVKPVWKLIALTSNFHSYLQLARTKG